MKTALNQIILSVVLMGSLSAVAAPPAKPAARATATVTSAPVSVSKGASPATTPRFTYATIQAIETFAQRRLTVRDFEAVKNVVQTLVLLDQQDPSRTAVMMLSESYGKYKVLYDRAFKAIETPQNRTIILELRELMSHFYEDGNG